MARFLTILALLVALVITTVMGETIWWNDTRITWDDKPNWQELDPTHATTPVMCENTKTLSYIQENRISSFAFDFVGEQFSIIGPFGPALSTFTLTVTTDGMSESVTINNVTASVCDYSFYMSNKMPFETHHVNVTVTDAWWLMLERIEIDNEPSNTFVRSGLTQGQIAGIAGGAVAALILSITIAALLISRAIKQRGIIAAAAQPPPQIVHVLPAGGNMDTDTEKGSFPPRTTSSVYY